jgi:hypothetical protein
MDSTATKPPSSFEYMKDSKGNEVNSGNWKQQQQQQWEQQQQQKPQQRPLTKPVKIILISVIALLVVGVFGQINSGIAFGHRNDPIAETAAPVHHTVSIGEYNDAWGAYEYALSHGTTEEIQATKAILTKYLRGWGIAP